MRRRKFIALLGGAAAKARRRACEQALSVSRCRWEANHQRFMPMTESQLAALVYDCDCSMIQNIAISPRPVDARSVAAAANQFLPANIPVAQA